MISGISASLSGLTAAQLKLSTTSHNIANANTDGFKKSRVVLEESGAGGVQASRESVTSSGPLRMKDTDRGVELVAQSNVDLGEEMVDLLQTRRFFEVNLQALDVQEQTVGALLDIHE